MFVVYLAYSLAFGMPAQAVSNSIVTDELATQLQAIVAAPHLGQSQIGIVVKRLSDNKNIFVYNADQLFVPASTIKLFTTAAALNTLGAEHQFATKLYSKKPRRGIIHGPLYIKGFGDPWLVTERVWAIAQNLKYQGITQIQGDIIVDASYFAGPAAAAGVEQDISSFAYMAPSGALSVGFNAVQIHIIPAHKPGRAAKIHIEPIDSHTTIQGRIITTRRKATRLHVEIKRDTQNSRIILKGNIHYRDKPKHLWRRIHNPALFAGKIFKNMLAQAGIQVKGKTNLGPVPASVPTLRSFKSPPLGQLIGSVNKYSNNFMASQLARVLGATEYGAPGTWAKGHQAIEKFLTQEVRIPKGQYTLANASGLHNVNRFSPRQVVELLAYMHQHPKWNNEFVSSLATPGGIGTLEDRLENLPNDQLLRAKTGTLSIASALSGYVRTRDGQLLAFSILINNFTSSIRSITKTQDRIGEILAQIDFTKTKLAAPALTFTPPTAADASILPP